MNIIISYDYKYIFLIGIVSGSHNNVFYFHSNKVTLAFWRLYFQNPSVIPNLYIIFRDLLMLFIGLKLYILKNPD